MTAILKRDLMDHLTLLRAVHLRAPQPQGGRLHCSVLAARPFVGHSSVMPQNRNSYCTCLMRLFEEVKMTEDLAPGSVDITCSVVPGHPGVGHVA